MVMDTSKNEMVQYSIDTNKCRAVLISQFFPIRFIIDFFSMSIFLIRFSILYALVIVFKVFILKLNRQFY